jgi:hypothetical protein
MASRGSALPDSNSTQTPIQTITPPPAYGGAAPPSMSSSPTGHLAPVTHNNPHYSDNEEDEYGEMDDDSLPKSLSAINIIIRCPLFIKGDSNLVAVDTSGSANKIAQGVVGALKTMSMSGHGVPMIDEDGRPRPISVTATAEVRIDGSKNVVGDKVRPMLPQSTPKPVLDNKEGTNINVKRERKESEDGESGPKRARLE